MRDELEALAADLRAVLEDATTRGAWGEDPEAPLPEAIAPEPVEAAAPASEGAAPDRAPADLPPVQATAWAALATSARQSAEERITHGAEGLTRLREELGDCRRCGLCRGRRHIVFGVGAPEADLVIVGEAPGFHEDAQGEPFVGEAGKMLDKMLENVLGLRREQVYICNVVKCRPPDNRDPEPPEVEACLPFLRRQIQAIEPKVLLVLGRVALQNLFGDPRAGIKRNRGTWREYEGIPVLPTFHPAYLLRQPQDKRLVFEDLKALRVRYDALGGGREG